MLRAGIQTVLQKVTKETERFCGTQNLSGCALRKCRIERNAFDAIVVNLHQGSLIEQPFYCRPNTDKSRREGHHRVGLTEPARIDQTGKNIIARELRIPRDDILRRISGTEKTQDGLNRNPGSPNHRPPRADLRIDFDMFHRRKACGPA